MYIEFFNTLASNQFYLNKKVWQQLHGSARNAEPSDIRIPLPELAHVQMEVNTYGQSLADGLRHFWNFNRMHAKNSVHSKLGDIRKILLCFSFHLGMITSVCANLLPGIPINGGIEEMSQEKSGLITYYDTTRLHLFVDLSHRGENFEKTVEYDDTEVQFKLYKVPDPSVFVPSVTVTLNGQVIYKYDKLNDICRLCFDPFDTTITANKGDKIKFNISNTAAGSFQYALYVDLKMSADIYSGVKPTFRNDFRVYPNPTKGRLTVELEKISESVVRIYNQLGEMVYVEQEINSPLTLDLNHFKKGLYFMTIESNFILYSKPIVIE